MMTDESQTYWDKYNFHVSVDISYKYQKLIAQSYHWLEAKESKPRPKPDLFKVKSEAKILFWISKLNKNNFATVAKTFLTFFKFQNCD